MEDVVIDTNIVLHAENAELGERCTSSQELFRALIRTQTRWCVDRGFDVRSERNSSRIFVEYLARTIPSMLGMQVFARLAATERVVMVQQAARSVRDSIRKHVWDPTDRVFVQVASGTHEHILVSHDGGFTAQCRRNLKSEVGVSIVEAIVACQKFA